MKVHATTVTIGDTIMRSLKIPGPWWERLGARLYLGIRKPKRPILGMELAGDVESVGRAVTRFKQGDPVFASTFGVDFGGYAQYKCLSEDGMIAAKPANVTYQEAAAVPGGGMTALRCLKKGNLRSGQKILIYGASGSVGTYAVQLASRHFGAEVTGVCSARNVELVRSIGADHVVDYTKQDFTQGGQRYDLILDNMGNRSFSDLRRALNPQGVIVPNSGHGGMGYVFRAFLLSPFTKQVARPFVTSTNRESLDSLRELIEAGKVTPVIDRTYPLSKVPEALGYLGQGHARGKVVITMG